MVYLIEVKKALEKGELCDHCLGRLTSLAFKGFAIEKVGASIRISETDEESSSNQSRV